MYNTMPLPRDVARRLADRFVKLRKERGWSQAETARRSGVSLGSLKRFEQQAKISLGHLLRLAHLFQRLEEFSQIFAWDEDLAAARKRFAEMDKS